MPEGRQQLTFREETLAQLSGEEPRSDHLDGDPVLEGAVGPLHQIDLPHPADAEEVHHAVGADPGAGGQRLQLEAG